jgi:RNAse (barnase) inhibitor barstar
VKASVVANVLPDLDGVLNGVMPAMVIVKIDARRITNWDTFHAVFQEAFGFPDFYGRNMNAWIDCMSSLDDPGAGMTTIHVQPGEVLVLQLEHVDEFSKRCPEQYIALIEDAAFVNWRRMEVGENAVLALSFFKGF